MKQYIFELVLIDYLIEYCSSNIHNCDIVVYDHPVKKNGNNIIDGYMIETELPMVFHKYFVIPFISCLFGVNVVPHWFKMTYPLMCKSIFEFLI